MHSTEFKDSVWQFYAQNKRTMPWRENTDPYWIVVSELMLQQTQVDRVIPKFNQFIEVFPSMQSLAEASLSEVLLLWNGLGYNRRAKFLHELSKKVVSKNNGEVPNNFTDLIALPGIGPNTAGAILAYAFNQPVVYIETNIRTVYLHHFFEGQLQIDDSSILPLIESTMDRDNPREWYWALMDYGSYLKKVTANPSRASKHYVKQSKFEGSKRQIRGRVLKLLLERPYAKQELMSELSDERVESVLDDLQTEHLIRFSGQKYRLPN